jgi:hypothetical protein
MTTTFNNYLCHTNTWYWGTSIDIVHKKGIGIPYTIYNKYDIKQYLSKEMAKS